MAESIEGGIVMGHALKTNQPGRLFHMSKKENPQQTWHYDWRGKVAMSAIYAGLVASGTAIGWSLWHLSSTHLFH